MERNGVLTQLITSSLHIIIVPSAPHCSYTPCVISSQLISVVLFLGNILRETDLSCICSTRAVKSVCQFMSTCFPNPCPLLFCISAQHCHSRIIADISADDNVISCNENMCVYTCVTVWGLIRLTVRAVPTQFNVRSEVKVLYIASENGDLVKRHLVSKWQIRLNVSCRSRHREAF